MAQDLRVERIVKQLTSSLTMLRHATREAEAWSDQTLADDLLNLELHHQAVLHALELRGRRYVCEHAFAPATR